MKRVARVVMVMLLVSTVVAGPAAAATASPRDATVQPEPPDPTPGCGEHIVEKAVQFLSPAYAAYDAVTGGDQCNVEEIRQGNQEQEMQDIHAQAQTLAVDQQSSLTAYSNALNDARTVAWTKAECASLDALEANATQAETRVAARDAIERYYSRMLTNVIAERNANWQEFMYLAQTRQNESLNQSVFVVDYMTTDDRLNHGLGAYNLTDTLNYTLPNGSIAQVEAMHGSASGTHIGGGGIGHFSGPLVEGATWPNSDDYGPEDVAWIHIRSTYDNDTVTAYNSTRWWNVIDRIENQNQQMLSNANQTVNGLYGSYVRGNFNISDYRSVQCTADQTGVGVNDTYYSIYAVSALAKAGAETPDLNSTGSMTIATSEFTANNTTEQFTGLLVASDVPGDSWQTGQTYDPATINGSVTFHVSDSNRSFFLSEPFTLVGAEGRDGQEISTVNTTQYQYRTENFSELGDKLDRLIELRQEEQVRIEDASNPDTGGTIGWPRLGGAGGLALGGGVVMLAIAAILVGIGVKLYFEVMTP
ncbi:hypothetical protein [Haloarchaeobius baliensis]|uniref:hypothetical protein n=1 Tax=Haloarchaeobius baliensis TaxID=1670458 RepID=UPI003F880B1E